MEGGLITPPALIGTGPLMGVTSGGPGCRPRRVSCCCISWMRQLIDDVVSEPAWTIRLSEQLELTD